MIPIIRITAIQALALAGASVALGMWLKRRIPVLDRLHIPAPIAGGMIFALTAFVLRDRVANFEVDTGLREILLIASFTAIGLNASFRILRKGGVLLLIVVVLGVVGSILQAGLGMGVAAAFGLDPRIGILAGPVSLAGGPGTALAFGPVFEQGGVGGATTIALAGATFGITVAGVIAGWTGGRLINRFELRPLTAPLSESTQSGGNDAKRASVMAHILVIVIAMGVGSLVSLAVQKSGVVLPAFVGALVVAVIVRNLDERYGWLGLSENTITQIVTVTLSLFIGIAMLTLRLWELTALALPLVAILTLGIAMTWLFCALVAFRALGRDYEAAVMTSGFSGFMIGITPNAMASMEELTRKYGPAPRAMLVVPLVGGFFIDVTNTIVITTIANLLR